jgi:hypothetical protein
MNTSTRFIPSQKNNNLFICVFILLAVLLLPANLFAQGKLKVFYAGPQGSVSNALSLAKDFEITSSPDADVFVLNGSIPNPLNIISKVKEGAGLVLIMGSQVTQDQVSTLLQ